MKNNWEVKKLGEIVSYFNDGNWVESDDQSSNGIRLIQTGNIGLGFFKDKGDKARYISEETFKRLNCTEIFEGDILISRLPDPVGRSCFLPKLNDRTITAVDCTIVRFSDDLFARYFQYYSMTGLYFNEIKKYHTGSSRVRISRSNLAKINVLVPPKSVQEEIVEKLDAIRKAQKLIDFQIQKAEELYRSLIQEELLSNGYNMVKLSEVIRPQEIIDPRKSPDQDFKYIDISSIDSANFLVDNSKIKEFKGRDAPSRARKSIQEGDLLFSTVRPNLRRIAIIDYPVFNSLASTGFTVLRPDESKINPSYMGTVTCSGIVTDQVLPYVQGAAYPAVSDSNVLNVEIPLPQRTEQDKIAEKFDAIQKYKKFLIKQKQLYKELFDSVLDKSMKGEI